ncbi:MAG: repeat protein [Planctomycetota bacterium]|nr:repeat protein [Planctomycetota bacterium]
MFSIKSLFKAVQTWRNRRGGSKTPKRTTIALERLDHRQLMSVNFTGNAKIDIPATTTPPGTVILVDNGSTRHPGIPPDIAPLIKVSGLDINGIRLAYTPTDDVLSIAIDQPDNQKTGQPVLAGDTDNNGDGATVAPDVKALRPGFIDFGFLGGSESMGVFLDLNNDTIPDVVAGISNDAGAGKLYQVADAVVNPDPILAAKTIPRFGVQELNSTGASFLSNDPAHPSFEFQVTNFSKLYQAKTGQPLKTTSIINFGAFGTSNDDDGISEAFFPAQPANFGVVPPVPPVCPPPPTPPPAEPPILVNPHQHRHVNTAHPTDVRVNILGSARFNVDKIVPESVTLGGAHQIFNFDRNINRDGIPDRTFVFRGSDIQLPGGITDAVVSGTLTDGSTFSSSYQIFNRNDAFYSPEQINARDLRQSREGFSATNPPLTPSQRHFLANHHDLAVAGVATSDNQAFQASSTVKIATRNDATAKPVTVDNSSQTMQTMPTGSPAASHAGQWSAHAESPLSVSIPRRPVAQGEKPVTVAIPRRSSITMPEVKPVPTARTRPLTSMPSRAGFARAARPAMAR